MSFLAACSAEWRKYPRWMTLALVTGLPLGIIALKTTAFLVKKDDLLAKNLFNWAGLFRVGHSEWTQMLLPLTLAGWAVYSCWLENEGNTWKVLLIQPSGRLRIYLAKLAVLLVWLGTFFALNLLGHWVAGGLLFPQQSTPLDQMVRFNGLALLFATPILAFQFWAATRFANPIAPLGLCLAGNIVALLGSGLWLRALPWHYSRFIGTTSWAENEAILAWALGSSLCFIGLGCWEFSRKDIP